MRFRARLLAIVSLLALAPVTRADVQLVPVATGLSSPLLATGARDGTNRLYVVERDGVVRLVKPGVQGTSIFLDLRGRVLAGGERGLLGLAFHPQYASNGRLFVFYTRPPDGALVIAEHRRRADPDVADPAGVDVLVIAHPRQSNHNGGMLAFGPDGYLYIGVGDGGASNDPTDNSQDVDVLLGKILRIDVDRSGPVFGSRYGAPPDNPFVDAPGADEVYAYGLRNPWRFGFDRSTGELWVGDVGQDGIEEVDAPILRGGNYGWRVYEGTNCTGNDPMLCNPTAFVAPRFQYAHTGGRCSVTGGYVYRGTRGTFASGTYVFGDFCGGEIMAFDGAAQAVVLDTTLALASFGEDDAGELYAVDIAGGTVSRIDPAAAGTTAIEYFHAGFGHYFVTSLPGEIAALDAGRFEGWARTGEQFDVFADNAAGRASVCRFFTASFAPRSSHFYTPVADECEVVKRNPDWQFEGEVFFVALPGADGACSPGTRPVYRMYNDGRSGAPNHRYTTRLELRAAMLAQGWIAEGFGTIGVIACVP